MICSVAVVAGELHQDFYVKLYKKPVLKALNSITTSENICSNWWSLVLDTHLLSIESGWGCC